MSRAFKQRRLSGLGGGTGTKRQHGNGCAEDPSRVIRLRVLVVSVVHEQLDAPRLVEMPSGSR
jgi:hypothetical protein